MCNGVEGCFLIRAYQQNLEKHGHDEALSAAASLYRRTNTEVSEEEAMAFVSRFVAPAPAVVDCSGCTAYQS